MTKSKAIEKIMKDMKLPEQCEGYVIYTIGRLGCGNTIDLETIDGIKQTIKQELYG